MLNPPVLKLKYSVIDNPSSNKTEKSLAIKMPVGKITSAILSGISVSYFFFLQKSVATKTATIIAMHIMIPYQ